MDLFSIITMIGGLAFFLYGMHLLSAGLEKVSGGRMEKLLEKLTKNIFLAVIFGALVTAAVQSSSATTVIVVGLVNAGMLRLRSAVGVIMGANIGTTITSWILSLSSLDPTGTTNFMFKIIKPTTLAPLMAIIGIVLIMASKRKTKKIVGEILIGFGILFNGMFIMTEAVKPLANNPAFKELFATLQNPILGVLVGAIVTAIIQSSSASVGILQALSATGAITCASAFPIIMGQNIGTCITPILSSIGANKNAKRTGIVHLYFNIIGSIIFLIIVYSLQSIINFSFWNAPITEVGIAGFHTVFNITITLLFLPFANLLAKIATWTIRDKPNNQIDEDDEVDMNLLDDRFLVSPSLAINQAKVCIEAMAKYSQKNYKRSLLLFNKYDNKIVDKIREREDFLDKMEDKVNNYLIKINDLSLTEQESLQTTTLLQLVSEFERIGDYVINIVEDAEKIYESQTKFSETAKNDLKIITDAVNEIIDMAVKTYINLDMTLSNRIEPLEETVDKMEDTLKYKHIQRLKNNKCTIDSGIIFLEILNNLERISDHCSNIAICVVNGYQNTEILNKHEYKQQLHLSKQPEYLSALNEYNEKYMLPIKN